MSERAMQRDDCSRGSQLRGPVLNEFTEMTITERGVRLARIDSDTDIPGM